MVYWEHERPTRMSRQRVLSPVRSWSDSCRRPGHRWCAGLIAWLFISGLAACGGELGLAPTAGPTEPSPADRVAALRRAYPADRYLLGLGVGDSDNVAVDLARADLAKQLRIEVRIRWTDLLKEAGGRSEQEVSRLIETRVAESVQGMDVVERGRDSRTGHAYAVAVLPKPMQGPVGAPAPAPASAGETAEPGEQPASTEEAIWVTAQGMATLGDQVTVADARAQARDDARRDAIAQAVGAWVTGRRVIYNAQVAEDLVRSVVRGIIVEEQMVEEGVRQVGEGTAPVLRYVSTLRAKVKPVRVERRGNFTLQAELDRTLYRDGDEMTIRVVASRDAYLHIFNVEEDETVTVLVPNRLTEAMTVKAHQPSVFPDDRLRSLGVRLRVSPPPGATQSRERIKVVATSSPLTLAREPTPDGAFQIHAGRARTLVTDLLRALAQLPEEQWTETTLAFEVRK